MPFEAYSVAVRVNLINGVSNALLNISRQFAKAHGDAKAFQRALNDIKLMMGGGGIMAATGVFGLNVIAKALPPAKEYAHQLAQMNIAGMQQAEIAKSITAAWALGAKIPTQSASQNLEMIKELRSVVGSTTEAINALPTVAKLQAVLSNVKGVTDAKGTAFEVAKTLDIRGASMDPQRFEAEAQAMVKAIVAGGGTIGVKDFFSAAKYGRTAATGWNNEFMYEILPTLIQEMKTGSGSGGAGGPGNALMSAYQAIVAGQMTKKSLTLFNQLGLVDPSRVVWNKVGDVKGVLPGGIRGSDLFQANPFAWSQQVLMPALKAAGITDPKQQQQYIAQLFGNRTASFVMSQMALQPDKFRRDQGLVKGAMGLEAYQKLLKNDPYMAEQALTAQWKDAKTQLGLQVLPLLIAGTQKLTGWMRRLNEWMLKNPEAVKGVVLGFTAISGALTFGGTLLVLAGGIRAVGLAFRLYKAAQLGSIATGLTQVATAAPGAAAGITGLAGAIAGAAALLANVVIPVAGAFAIGATTSNAQRYKAIRLAGRGASADDQAWALQYAQTNLRAAQRLDQGRGRSSERLQSKWRTEVDAIAGAGARPYGSLNGASPYVGGRAPAPRGGGVGTVYLDKKAVGKVVDEHFAQPASQRYFGTPRGDPGMILAGGATGHAR